MPESAISIVATFAIGFSVFFAGIWVFVCLLLARVGGWSRLAAVYQTREIFAGPCTTTVGLVGSARYKNSLRVGADEHGLWLDVPAVMRPGHKALRLPWSDLQEQEGQTFRGIRLTAFRPRQVPEVRVQIPTTVVSKLRG